MSYFVLPSVKNFDVSFSHVSGTITSVGEKVDDLICSAFDYS